MRGKDAGGQPKPTDGDGLNNVARSIREVEVLLVALTTLYFFVAPVGAASAGDWFLCTAGYLLALGALRLLPAFRARPRARLHLELAMMILFVTSLIALAGAAAGPLTHLYLLPVITSALLLGRPATAFFLALILLGRLAIGVAGAGISWFSLRELAVLFAELAPALLVAFLTSALRKDLTSARTRIRTLAQHDELTGLLNHRTFLRLATEEVQSTDARGAPCAILILDVDNLSEINDRFGHESGDRALVAVAEGLRRALRASDPCARYSGDQYAVLLPGCGRDSAEIMANRIRHHVFSATQDFDYAMRRLAVSIGIAVQPDDGHDLRHLLRSASRALRRDQGLRRARVGAAPLPGGVRPP